jgi:microcystin-dependent protein
MGNQGGVYTWSQTAAANATADNTVNWQEGQAPSSINDSGRAMMASIAKYRDDISGSIVTTGTSTAYIVASNQDFDTLSDFNGKVIAFTPHATNGPGPVTMTVDGFANLPLRSAPNTELPSGVLILGTPYMARFNQTDNALYLMGFFGNLGLPLLGGMDYWDTIAPSSQFIFPLGQAISRTAFPQAFARWGTQFGAGDGATTFNVPNVAGRVRAMLEATPTLLTTAIAAFVGAGNSTVLGAECGAQDSVLVTANLPPYTPQGTIANGAISTANGGNFLVGSPGDLQEAAPDSGNLLIVQTQTLAGLTFNQGTSNFNGTAQGGASSPVKTVQPTIMCNYIIRII